jgi:hypothetical protein
VIVLEVYWGSIIKFRASVSLIPITLDSSTDFSLQAGACDPVSFFLQLTIEKFQSINKKRNKK